MYLLFEYAEVFESYIPLFLAIIPVYPVHLYSINKKIYIKFKWYFVSLCTNLKYGMHSIRCKKLKLLLQENKPYLEC